MKGTQIFLSALTAFVITGGGAVGVVMASANEVNAKVWICSAVLGAVAAAKDARALMSLPPLSNGQYAALSRLYRDNPEAEQEAQRVAEQKATPPPPKV